MQAAASLCLFPAPVPLRRRSLVPREAASTLVRKPVRLPAISAVANSPETLTVDYSSPTSVFPAEACETIGGEACDVEMFPEVKPVSQQAAAAAAAATTASGLKASEEVDREYLDYNEPKTVFPGEACDDLGGEFCEAEYQAGVYREQQQQQPPAK